MSQIKILGSLFSSLRDAAAAWAAAALPDVSVLNADEQPATVARDLEAFWWGEAQKIDGGTPDDVDEETWREACRAALVDRIERALRENRRAVRGMHRA